MTTATNVEATVDPWPWTIPISGWDGKLALGWIPLNGPLVVTLIAVEAAVVF